MTSRLGRNLRKGHLAEDLGISVVRAFSAVADVRHQDDVGVDAYCVLLRPEGRLLLAEDLFGVQFKSDSVSTIEYSTDSVDWFIKVQVPLFFGQVDASSGTVSFFTSTRYRQHLFNAEDVSRIVLDFNSTDSSLDETTIFAGMSPPILECDERESRTDDFAIHAYSILRKWIAFEKRAIDLQRLNIHVTAKWNRGGEPEEFFRGSSTSISERKTHMGTSLPFIDKLSFHAMGTTHHDPTLLGAFVRIFRWYQEEGFESEDLPIDTITSTMQSWESKEENENT